MNTYFETFADEILSKFNRVSKLTKHPPSIGTYRETLIKNFLSNFLSNRYSINSGFVYDTKTNKCSKQIDVLIVDENVSAPFLFKDKDFVIAKPDAVVLGIEIKSSLSIKYFREAIENCLSFKALCPLVQFIIFSFDGSKNLSKNADLWYKNIDSTNGKINLYPNSVYCMKRGRFGLVPPKFATNWGHYFMRPSNTKKDIEPTMLSYFLSDIAKNIDIKIKQNSNPYSEYTNESLFVQNGCYRFGLGKITGEIRLF